MIKEKQQYLSLFGVTEEVLRRLVAEGIARGGDYSDLFFENSTMGNLLLRDGEVTSGGNHIDYGVGIRVLSGDKTGYAYAESTAWGDMLAAARAAAAIAGGNGAETFNVNDVTTLINYILYSHPSEVTLNVNDVTTLIAYILNN